MSERIPKAAEQEVQIPTALRRGNRLQGTSQGRDPAAQFEIVLLAFGGIAQHLDDRVETPHLRLGEPPRPFIERAIGMK